MRVIAVTTCTDRKKFPVPDDLDASQLPVGPQSDVARLWRERVKSAGPVGIATEVYSGRSFQEAVFAARAGCGELRIISGGLGLIRGDDEIPSYSLSLVRQSSEFIGARVTGEPFNAARWWKEVQRSAQSSPLAELLRTNPTTAVVIGISKAYLPLISEDLLSLEDRELDRLRLLGMGIWNACPSRLQNCILPYDDRLDGPDSPIRGTRTDFSSRAMRHFIESVLVERQVGSIEDCKNTVIRLLGRWRRPKSVSRPSKTDEEIVALIRRNWKAIKGKSSLGLRYLRDVENIACEQGRFRSLFHRAAKEVGS
jgi:hypothetical protein